MKIKTIIGSALAASLLVGCASESQEHEGNEAKEATLAAQARVSKDDAVKTALATVPDGIIKEGELEKEHGKLIWSFDIATPNTKDITEVNVDAITGGIVSTTKETPKDQEKERKENK